MALLATETDTFAFLLLSDSSSFRAICAFFCFLEKLPTYSPTSVKAQRSIQGAGSITSGECFYYTRDLNQNDQTTESLVLMTSIFPISSCVLWSQSLKHLHFIQDSLEGPNQMHNRGFHWVLLNACFLLCLRGTTVAMWQTMVVSTGLPPNIQKLQEDTWNN